MSKKILIKDSKANKEDKIFAVENIFWYGCHVFITFYFLHFISYFRPYKLNKTSLGKTAVRNILNRVATFCREI